MKAIIIGAGIGGLASAIGLRKAGWDVAVFERTPTLEPMGAALSLWPNAVDALDWLGRGDALRAVAQPFAQVALAERDGRDIARIDVDKVVSGKTGYLPTRTELQRLLLDGLDETPLVLGERYSSHVESPDGVLVTFDSGRQEKADLLVAADGIWSRIAEGIGHPAAQHAGYGGVLALSDTVPGFPTTRIGTEYWGHQERMGVFDLKAGRKYWFYMKNERDPAEAEAITLDYVAERLRGWAEEIRAAVAATPAERLIPFSIRAKPAPKTMARGRIILVGDAGHAMEPNMGQGACQAIEDAVALSVAAKTGNVGGIAALYEAMRLQRVRKFVAMSQQGSIVAHRLPRALSALVIPAMRWIFPITARRQMRALYRLPDYDRIS